MIEALKLWNEPNNLSHWDFQMDPEWREFSETIGLAARAVRQMCPGLPLVLGGMSPIDARFLGRLKSYGLLERQWAFANGSISRITGSILPCNG